MCTHIWTQHTRTRSHRIMCDCRCWWWRRWRRCKKNLFLFVWKLCLEICIIFTPQPGTASSEWISCCIWPLFCPFLSSFSVYAHVNLLVCIYFAMSTYKECTLAELFVLLTYLNSFVHIRCCVLFLCQFNEVVSALLSKLAQIRNRLRFIFFIYSCTLGWLLCC